MTNKKSRRYPAKTITDADYVDDIAILGNTTNQAETLRHSLERAAADIGVHVNAYICKILLIPCPLAKAAWATETVLSPLVGGWWGQSIAGAFTCCMMKYIWNCKSTISIQSQDYTKFRCLSVLVSSLIITQLNFNYVENYVEIPMTLKSRFKLTSLN